MNNNPSRRFWEAMIGIFLVIIGLSALGEGFPALAMLGIGAFLLWRQMGGDTDISSIFQQFTQPGERERQREEAYEEVETGRQSGAEKVYAHALRAVERAGLDPNDVRVLPVDVGVMAFRGDLDPMVYRTHDVPDDIDYIQPFVQLRLPTKANGRVKFEIIDSDGQAIFIHEDIVHLERGRNLVTPSARLPIHDAHAMHRNWQLRISADGMPLATHNFGWQESDTRMVRRHLSEDGEISNELRATLAENRLQKLSLDELLSMQDGDAEAEKRGRK